MPEFVNKTHEWLYKEHGQDVAAAYLRNCYLDRAVSGLGNDEVKNLVTTYESLIDSFVWSATPEGPKFWSQLYKKQIEVLRNEAN
jgi:hypothetical protein